MNSKFFDRAKKIAMEAPSKFKLGALLVIGKNTYEAYNYIDTVSPKPAPHIITRHAEMAVLDKAIANGERHRLPIAELYVYRITTYGQAMAKPCEHCMREINKWGIKKVYYTTQFGYEKL